MTFRCAARRVLEQQLAQRALGQLQQEPPNIGTTTSGFGWCDRRTYPGFFAVRSPSRPGGCVGSASRASGLTVLGRGRGRKDGAARPVSTAPFCRAVGRIQNMAPVGIPLPGAPLSAPPPLIPFRSHQPPSNRPSHLPCLQRSTGRRSAIASGWASRRWMPRSLERCVGSRRADSPIRLCNTNLH